jgi:pimeloyl-ACP methyl ester carboxylesterase
MPAEFVDALRGTPIWTGVEQVAGTIAYDGRIMGTTMSGNPLPTDRWSAVNVPVLVMHGDKTPPYLKVGPEAVAELLPTARLLPVPGENHNVEPPVLAPVLSDFAKEL